MLSTIIAAFAGLMIEETTDLSPTPFVSGLGAVTGVLVMKFARKADERDR
ncbi:hypothetical protein [Actinoplanes aureus]|uniref:Uncharacterized protein n=1 Tax=Actinoplanes aureus TaxID=2792083 RepID=A0A931CQI9_9ACTN|nr:hypothetical protein [Actinoplanes aureus]MBG0569290.1 hypothetical protein [Actinoplanes aureus]